MGRWKFPLAMLAVAALLLWPETALNAGREAMRTWAASVAPALFPFLLLMPALTGAEAARAYEALLGRWMRPLLGLPGATAPAVAVGMLAGSPAGAAAAVRTAKRTGMDARTLERLTGCVCGLGPGFLVSGIGASMLGSDVENDDRYRSRIQLAPESYTCAGPIGAYRHHALRVHQDIAEAAVWSPKPGHVDVRPVMSGGELPSADVLEAVRRALSADDVRPLTDTVTVQAPELVTYDVRLTWYLTRTQEPLLDTVRGRVSAAVERYRLWQRSMPGRDILPLRLCSLLEQAGVRRVELASPVYQPLKGYQLAREGEISVTFGGIEDD